MQWEKIHIKTDDDSIREAIAPVIISASRATDIPAFYSKWLVNRLGKGYVKWSNPFNPTQQQYISFRNTRLFVFWTKNPSSILPLLEEWNKRTLNYYFHFTVNDYDKEGFEPNVPQLSKRIETFKRLAGQIGKEKVIWRISPFIRAEKLPPEELLERTYRMGNELIRCTDKLAIGFSDVFKYKKVQQNLIKESPYYNSGNLHLSEFTEEEKQLMAKELASMRDTWKLINPNFEIGTCSETEDFSTYGILPNRCIDDELIIKLFPNDIDLMNFIGYQPGLFDTGDNRTEQQKKRLKDRNQRPVCNCIYSKDIGSYDTCPHFCIYCYANKSRSKVMSKIKSLNDDSEALL